MKASLLTLELVGQTLQVFKPHNESDFQTVFTTRSSSLAVNITSNPLYILFAWAMSEFGVWCIIHIINCERE